MDEIIRNEITKYVDLVFFNCLTHQDYIIAPIQEENFSFYVKYYTSILCKNYSKNQKLINNIFVGKTISSTKMYRYPIYEFWSFIKRKSDHFYHGDLIKCLSSLRDKIEIYNEQIHNKLRLKFPNGVCMIIVNKL